jgi:hypothetical protein
VYANGLIESGWFQNGKLSGYGERLQPDKVRYEGFFIHGLEEGQGKATYPSGNYFEGLWSSGLPLAGVCVCVPRVCARVCHVCVFCVDAHEGTRTFRVCLEVYVCVCVCVCFFEATSSERHPACVCVCVSV